MARQTGARFVLGLLAASSILTPAIAERGDREVAAQKAQQIVNALTLDEKVDQLLNVAPAIPRLGIPNYNWWTESLHGAIGTVPTTNFPEPIGLAATFDAPLVQQVAGAISSEVRGLHALARRVGRYGRIGTGLDTWSPNINIFRDPRWGRGQETYGEDPFLTARIGVAFVQGMQGDNPDLPDIIATPKHFAVHSGPESTRHSANVFVSAHDLEDTYLPAFRAAIVEGHAGSIMCAYNRIDGQPACANDLLLKEHLRGAWKFNGYVVSDCDAVRDIADNHKYAPDPAVAAAVALKAGVDNECNTAALFDAGDLGNRYKAAYDRGLISMADIDQALVRLFSARLRNGDLPGLKRPDKPAPMLPLTTSDHRALALETAEKSIVLLKNDGVLPLRPGLRIAVVGPHADATRVLRGNYSSALNGERVSILGGLRLAMPNARITLVPFSSSITGLDPVPTSALRTPDGRPGLLAQYFEPTVKPAARFTPAEGFGETVKAMAYQTRPTVSRVEPDVTARAYDLPQVGDHHRVVYTGFLIPPESGTYQIGLGGLAGEVSLDGKTILTLDRVAWGGHKLTEMILQKGRRYRIRVVGEAHALSGCDLTWKHIIANPDAALKAAAADADVIVAAVGLTSDLEGEEMKIQIDGFSGGDKTSLDLPADQRHLLEQAKATGKPVVVVAMNGSPIDLSWAKENASAIIEAWYPGETGGLAVADVLSGKADAGGRLPLTFYRSVADLPPFDDYAMRGRTYRYFQGKPVYPFGYGLSYARFDYAPLKVEPRAGGAEKGIRVTTEVRNVSARDGDEVAQLYLTPPAFQGAPRLALRGFARMHLAAGERRKISFDLDPRDLSFVTRDGARQVMAGTYGVSVGSGQPDTGVPARAASFSTDTVVPIPE